MKTRIDAVTSADRFARNAVAAVMAVCVSVVITVGSRSAQRELATLHPLRVVLVQPERVGELATMLDVSFVTSDELTIRGWYVPSQNGAVVILGHGHGGSRMDVLAEARALARHGYGVLLFDWRAHGASGGEKSTWGELEKRDATAALDFVSSRPDVDATRIGALGFSMGAMTLVQVAATDQRIRALALEGVMPTLAQTIELHSNRWGALSAIPARWAMDREIEVDSVRPADVICSLQPRPILIVCGDAREELPDGIARSVFAAACEPKEYWRVPGAAHGEYARLAMPELERRLVALFDGALREH